MHDNPNICEVNGIRCKLELGNWSIDKIDALLNEANFHSSTLGQKIVFIIQYFMGTPFIYDAQLPLAEEGTLKIRLKSFDNFTFVHNMLALYKANNFEEYVKNLYEVEFAWPEKNIINNDPDKGNRLLFACESVLINAIKQGYVHDITAELVDVEKIDRVEIDIQRYKRPKKTDQKELFVSPKYKSGIKKEHFINANNIDKINKDLVKTGDIILLTKGKISNRGVKQNVLINHLVFAYKEYGEIYFIHASKDFIFRSPVVSDAANLYAKVYYDSKLAKEQLGVSFGYKHLGEKFNMDLNGVEYWAYDPLIKECLIDYIKPNYWGVKILRVL